MSTDPVSKIITATVGGFVKDGKMFSAYDVTTKIRGMGVYCKHHAVKSDIHSAMADVISDGSEDYEKTLVDTGSYRTFVYHKSTDDPHTYNASDDAATPTVAPVTPVAPTTPISKTAPISKGASTTAMRDSRGRVCLPADMLRSIGATKGKKVVVSPQKGEVVVCPYNPSHGIGKSSHVYKVDRDNNVRLSAGIFAKAQLGTFQSFNVLQDSDSITVY